MLFQKKVIGNSRTALLQHKTVEQDRQYFNTNALMVNAHNPDQAMYRNQGLIPQDVYQEFDNITVERMRSDDGDAFLDPLLAMSKSISIGKLVNRYRQASDAGNSQTSMGGQIGVLMDQVDYTYDGSIIPIHDGGFKRNFREMAAMKSEDFDALIDDQRESVADVKRRLVANFLDGHRDKDNNLIIVDGLGWSGVRGDDRVAQVDLGAAGLDFDFADQTRNPEDIKIAFIALRDVLRIDNNCTQDLMWFFSREAMSNFERNFSEEHASRTIYEELMKLRGVDEILETNEFEGTELMAFPKNQDKIRPMVGMAMNTVAKPRVHYNDDYQFVTWAAVGYEVRPDFAGRTCVLHANV